MVRAMHDVIARISAAGRAAWPEIVPTDELAARIALPAADPAHDAELYLASALALRDPAIDDLAELYRVHRVTCSRWIAEARSELGRATRKQLSRALSLDLRELDTLLRFLDSDIELSVSRLLGAA